MRKCRDPNVVIGDKNQFFAVYVRVKVVPNHGNPRRSAQTAFYKIKVLKIDICAPHFFEFEVPNGSAKAEGTLVALTIHAAVGCLNLVDIDENDKTLVEKTRLLVEERRSSISGVSAGIRTVAGNEFFGPCIDAKTATVGICAEYSGGERRIRTLVAVTDKGRWKSAILPPMREVS